MKKYYITAERVRELTHRVTYKGGSETFEFDYSAWAEDNGTVTDVTITVDSGNADVSNEALASNVKSFVLTTGEEGRSLLKLVATAGNNKDIQYLDIKTRDPKLPASDYGLIA